MAHYPAILDETFGYDESLKKTYKGGQFVPLRVGRAWRFYDPAKHMRPVEYDSALPLILACDFNVDTLRWEVGQFTPSEIHWIDEISLGFGGSTESAVREFVRRWAGKSPESIYVTGDASGYARSTSGKADYVILREELLKAWQSVQVRVPRANPRQKDRVDNTNYHLAGRGRILLVSPRCKELRKDWSACSWREGTLELDKTDPQRTHAADAADYAMWALTRVVGSFADRFAGGGGSKTSDEALDARF
jgi:hypothetical protein